VTQKAFKFSHLSPDLNGFEIYFHKSRNFAKSAHTVLYLHGLIGRNACVRERKKKNESSFCPHYTHVCTYVSANSNQDFFEGTWAQSFAMLHVVVKNVAKLS
jgi:hypothetical protein